jgi:hypothetical protein
VPPQRVWTTRTSARLRRSLQTRQPRHTRLNSRRKGRSSARLRRGNAVAHRRPRTNQRGTRRTILDRALNDESRVQKDPRSLPSIRQSLHQVPPEQCFPLAVFASVRHYRRAHHVPCTDGKEFESSIYFRNRRRCSRPGLLIKPTFGFHKSKPRLLLALDRCRSDFSCLSE